jgi:hypothetical protein
MRIQTKTRKKIFLDSEVRQTQKRLLFEWLRDVERSRIFEELMAFRTFMFENLSDGVRK